MTKWKNLAGKFTEREIELIEKFQKKCGIENPSQMVRFSILFTILYIEVMSGFVNSAYAKTVDSKNKELKKEISNLPPTVTERIRSFVKEMEQDVTKTLETIANRKARNLSSFTEKRQIGRPKATKS